MSELNPVVMSYDGKEYKVGSDDGIWGLIEAVEDVIPYMELLPKVLTNNVPATKIFRAFATALQYAGCRDVNMHDIRKAASYEDLGAMAGQVLAILQMGQPGADLVSADDARKPPAEGEDQKKKAEA